MKVESVEEDEVTAEGMPTGRDAEKKSSRSEATNQMQRKTLIDRGSFKSCTETLLIVNSKKLRTRNCAEFAQELVGRRETKEDEKNI